VKGRPWRIACGRQSAARDAGPSSASPATYRAKARRLPVGIGPRFPVGNGEPERLVCRSAGRPGAAAAGRMAEGCLPDGVAGRAAAGDAWRSSKAQVGESESAGAVLPVEKVSRPAVTAAGTGAGVLVLLEPATAGASGAIGPLPPVKAGDCG